MNAVVRTLAFLAHAAALGALAAGEPASPTGAPGEVTQVTLYREQALVTRTIPVTGPAGGLEIVVGDLPEAIIAESLFAEGGEGLEVRAVAHRSRAVGQEPREEIRRIDASIEEIGKKLEANRKNVELVAKQNTYLDQLEGFIAPTMKTDLAQGVLDADALQKITHFAFEQRSQLNDRALVLEQESRELGKQLELLERSRAERADGASRTMHEALVFIDKRADGPLSLRLSYLVGRCGWSPAYTVRAEAEGQPITVQCSGLIRQMTGEDWRGVALTLSTATPAVSASRPALAPLPIVLVPENAQGKLGPTELMARLEEIRQNRSQAMAESRQAATVDAQSKANWALNAAANQFQSLELLSGRNLVDTLQSGDEQDEGQSLSYELAAPVSLASRADEQMVQVFARPFEGQFYAVASPVLTRHVYREAELVNTSDQDLLAGPMSVYLTGRFVGRSEIPTVARGQRFILGLGVDPQLRARRELLDRTETVQGGNRQVEMKYRIVLENYRDQDVAARVYDRLPFAEGSSDIRVTLADLEDPLDTDPVYLGRQRPKGILRWPITVPAGAVRDRARRIEYGFTIEFERTSQLGSLEGGQQQAEYDQLERLKVAPASAAETAPAPASMPEPPAP
jgi:hypothetical protein